MQWSLHRSVYGFAAERPVRAFVIVSPEPSRRKFLSLIDEFGQIMYQPVIANRSVVTLDISILLCFFGLNKSDFCI